jgi:hypothetical protein
MPPRRPCNVAQKCTAKKLKIIESTAKEVSSSSSVVEYLSWSIAFHCPIPWIREKRTPGTRWEERLRGAAVQSPPLKQPCRMQHSRRLLLVGCGRRQKKGVHSPPRLL